MPGLMYQFVYIGAAAHHDEPLRTAENIIGRGQGHEIAAPLDRQDVEVVFGAYALVADGFALPRFGGGDFIDRVFGGKLDIVEDVVCAVFDGEPFRHFFFGEYYFIRAVAQQKFRLDFGGRAGKHKFRAALFQEGSRFQRRLKVFAHGDDADIEVVDAERFEYRRLCSVADLCAGNEGEDFIDFSSSLSSTITWFPSSVNFLAMYVPNLPRPMISTDFIKNIPHFLKDRQFFTQASAAARREFREVNNSLVPKSQFWISV